MRSLQSGDVRTGQTFNQDVLRCTNEENNPKIIHDINNNQLYTKSNDFKSAQNLLTLI